MNVSQRRGIRAVYANSSTAELVAAELDRWNAELVKFRRQTEAGIQAATQKAEAANLNLLEIEQKVADYSLRTPGTNAGNAAAALASTLSRSAEFQAVASRRATKTSIDVNSGLLLPVQANTIKYGTGAPGVTQPLPGIVSGMQRRSWLREFIQSVQVTGGSVEYSRETSFTNAAAPQGGGSPFEHEGVLKPESSLVYEQIDIKVPTIAHWIKASKQILADVPMLQQTLEQRLLYGLELALESQIVSGTGVGANMRGLTLAGNHTPFTPTSGDTSIDSINRALAMLEVANAVPNLVVMHPTDYRSMQRIKGTDAAYVLGDPGGPNAATVWNTPIYVSPAVTLGKFIALDTAQMGVLFTREDARVEAGFEGSDFIANRVVLLAELRAALAVQRPAAVVFGSLVL
ncbi:MAG: phage major capsid protein [Pseudomonadota bacterium]